jgi:hypothetical protein
VQDNTYSIEEDKLNLKNKANLGKKKVSWRAILGWLFAL